MEEKELKQLLEGVAKENGKAIEATVKAEVQAAVAGLMKSDELGAKLESMGLKEGTIKMLTEAVEKQGVEIGKFMQPKGSQKAWDEIVDEKAEAIKQIPNSTSRLRIKLPSANKALVLRSAITNNTGGMYLNDVGQLQWIGGGISNLFTHVPVGPDSNGVIRYRDQSTATMNAAETAEGAQKPESVYAWTQYVLPIEKIAVSIPVSKEAWMDINIIKDEINTLMNRDLMLRENLQLYSGDGNTPNLKGVYTSAGAFDNTGIAGTIDDANIFDLIAAVRMSIMKAGGGKYNPNIVLMNPSDIYRYKVQKAADGHYVMPPFVGPNGQVIDGMRVIEDANVTANSLVVGDFNYGKIYDLEGVTIDMGYVNTQFIENEFTILAEKRLALLIRTADVTGFKKVANITTAVAALQTA
jgi:hypothetical protein